MPELELTLLTISIMIPSWKRPESLHRCLLALTLQTRLPDEVIVVARNGDSETLRAIEAHDWPFACRVATAPRPGLIAALNAGFDASGSDIVVATDDDTAARPDWVERIGRRFTDEPLLGVLGGPDRMVHADHPPDGIPGTMVGKVEWFGRVVGNHHLGSDGVREVDIIKGANMAIRRSALGSRRIDTLLRGAGAEHHSELDLCLGLKADGWLIVYDPQVVVDHYEEPREGGQRENLMDAAERHDAIFNQTYALLKHLRPVRRLVAFSYGLLVGTRDNPGLLLGLERMLMPSRAMATASSPLRVNFSARVSALWAWVWHRR